MERLSRPSPSHNAGLTSPIESTEDTTLDTTLRPHTWADFVGQENTKQNLKIIIEAARQRGEPHTEHLLLYGNSGLGKTSLASLVAREMGAHLRTTTGPALQKVGDLAAILTNLNEGDVLFCDECHRLNKLIEEFLYPALEDFKLQLVLGKGPMAKTMELDLPRFTFIGATTKAALISAPLRNRFGATFQLNFYTEDDLEKIITRASRILQVQADPAALKLISHCARFTPRVANRLLKRVRDVAQVKGEGVITVEMTKKALAFLGIDALGLEAGDRKLLRTLITKFSGGPVGLQALAAACAEEEETILDLYEPYLMRLGFIERTPRGRSATKLAYQHLGHTRKENNQENFFS